MKPLPQRHETRLKPLRVHLDDLRAVWDLLAAFIGEAALTADRYRADEWGYVNGSIPGYSFDSIETLIEHGKTHRSVPLVSFYAEKHKRGESRRRQVTVTLGKGGATVRTETDHADTLGVCDQVAIRLGRCRRRRFGVWLLVISFSALGGLVGLAASAAPGHLAWRILIPSVVVGALVTVIVRTTEIARHCSITLVSRGDAPSFFERNRDEFIMKGIWAFVGAALGVAGTLIAQAISAKK